MGPRKKEGRGVGKKFCLILCYFLFFKECNSLFKKKLKQLQNAVNIKNQELCFNRDRKTQYLSIQPLFFPGQRLNGKILSLPVKNLQHYEKLLMS